MSNNPELDAEFARWDAMIAEAGARYVRDGIKHARFSMFESNIEDLDKQFHEGRAQVVIDSGWGSKETYSSIKENPTLWDMFILFDEALTKNGDHHHVFLERLSVRSITGSGLTVFSAITGS